MVSASAPWSSSVVPGVSATVSVKVSGEFDAWTWNVPPGTNSAAAAGADARASTLANKAAGTADRCRQLFMTIPPEIGLMTPAVWEKPRRGASAAG